MIDFEKGLQNALKINFPISNVDGCFFYFAKLLGSKAKEYGLCKKEELKKTKLLVFVLKLLTFMNPDYKINFFDKLEDYFSINNDKFTKLVKYYKKNWLKK